MASRAGIKNYDISFKIAACEEYLSLLKTNPNLSKREFATSRSIKSTTFQDWIKAYLKDQNKQDGLITTSSSGIVTVPKFVELSDKENDKTVITSYNKMTLKYKDVSLEFSSSDFEKVLEIIRRW